MQRFALFCALTLLIVPQPAHTRLRAAAKDPGDAIKTALAKPTSVSFEQVPLQDAVRRLAERSGVSIVLDLKATDDAALDPRTPVSVKAEGLKLQSVLKMLCRPLELEAVPRGDLLLITTKDEASQILQTRVYDVRDLYDYDLRQQRRMDPSVEDRDELMIDVQPLENLVEYAIDPSAWGNSGGPGSIARFGGTIIVSQTYGNHERIAALLDRLRQLLRQRESKQPPVAPEDALARLRGKLGQKISANFIERPLREVLDQLAKEHNVAIGLDSKTLSDAGLSDETPVSIRLSNVALDTALREMLKPFDMTHVIDDDFVLVTTADEAGNMVYAEIYDVHDLVDPSRLSPTREPPSQEEERMDYDYQSLLEVVTATVAPTTWQQSGPSEGACYLGTVTWLQTQAAHAEIADLLAQLRQAHRRPITPLVGKAAEEPRPPPDPNAIELRVYKLNWSVPGSMRQEVNASKPLDAAGAGAGSPTPSPTVSTVADDYRPMPEALRYTQRVGQAIVAVIERESWEEYGGRGILQAIPSNEPHVAGTLLVRQTAAVHKQIAKLLRDIKSAGPYDGGFGGGGFF